LGKSKALQKSKQSTAKPTAKLPRDFYDIFTGSQAVEELRVSEREREREQLGGEMRRLLHGSRLTDASLRERRV